MTKAQLMEELSRARRRIAELESSTAKLEDARAALRKSQDRLSRYRVLFETFPLGISIADGDGRLVEANRKAEKLLGLSRRRHIRRTIDARPGGSSGRTARPCRWMNMPASGP